ncbi:unnamed protein product [Closterium sp. NIES-53]
MPFLSPELGTFDRTSDLITHLRSLDVNYRAVCTEAELHYSPSHGVASEYHVWCCLALVRVTSADKLSACFLPCVFLGFLFTVDSGGVGVGGMGTRGVGSEGAGIGGASFGGAGAEGAGVRGASSRGARVGGVGTKGASSGGAGSGGVGTGGASFGVLEMQVLVLRRLEVLALEAPLIRSLPRLPTTTRRDPTTSPSSVSALVAVVADFATTRRLEYATRTVDRPPRCIAAMDSEMASWRSTGTYVETVPPPRANVFDGMWILKVKQPQRSPPIFKVHYMARGFSQCERVDFFQTFAPTPKMATLRVLIHVAAKQVYELHSLGFSTAFLQGRLHEEIWLRCPPGFTGTFPPRT